MPGFTQIPNVIFENPIREKGAVSKQYARLELYHLAQFKDCDFEVRGSIIRAKVGQAVRSIKYFSKRWKWSEGKVRRFFKHLERRGEIEWHKNKDCTTITLLNYVKNGRANGRQAVGRQDTNNIDNTDNTINTHKGCDDVDDESINRIWSKWSGNGDTPPPPNQTKTIVDALNEHSLEYWIPFLEKRQNIKDKGGFSFDNMKHWFNGGYLEMSEKSQPKQKQFHQSITGLYKAFCGKCYKRAMPNEHQLRKGSECCGVEYVPEIPIFDEKPNKSMDTRANGQQELSSIVKGVMSNSETNT